MGNEIVEFCFRPRCWYGHSEVPPYWFPDPLSPFIEEDELGPRLYCPACGKPRWLALDADEFVKRFSFDIEPTGTYIYPKQDAATYLTSMHAQASDVRIEVRDKAGHQVASLWDLRVRAAGERSIREMYHLGSPDACKYGPLTPCERMVCAVCGNQNWQQGQFTPVMTRPGDIVWVCRQGHFQGESIDPYTGMVWHMTGPKMLEILEWTPELVVPELKHRWWGAPGIWGCDCAY